MFIYSQSCITNNSIVVPYYKSLKYSYMHLLCFDCIYEISYKYQY